MERSGNEEGLDQHNVVLYIIKSINHPDQEYTGATEDLKQRIKDHNSSKSTHTAKFAPWELLWYCAFPDKYAALEFEKYLKSHSGRVFVKKRLIKEKEVQFLIPRPQEL